MGPFNVVISEQILERPITKMKTLAITALLLVAVAYTDAGCSGYYRGRSGYRPSPTARSAPPPPLPTIAGLVVADSRFSTLLAAVKAAGLVDTLNSAGPFTVFAPTNDAFAKVPADALAGLLADKDALTAVLLRHVISGSAIRAEKIPAGDTTLATAGGEEITANRNYRNRISITNSQNPPVSSNAILFNVEASNGIVHAVDTVF